ncbi:N-acetyltransferase [Caulobacter segnis]|uniref:GCN5-related N-acetyltransferase n=2 Tax=Caulobacter segnis TaxID=88688 RepID=D5VI14_CAUST|nr:GNAT family N-acetyltransferase [Caulobacter segnis]ADG09267.1 GCN5-related N-acetyltransferase [Caulobacter segnis ATCC 21756]AVQ01075.1 N-acetyltransferase [Caulobacter segnis]
MAVVLRPFAPGDEDAVIAVILPIQREEFGVAITAADQPDLADIPGWYQVGAGQFWLAELDGRVVGTIALKDIGGGAVALRKMFVRAEARGPGGVAQALLDGALAHARAHGVSAIWLGTTDAFKAAHRFYERNGFSLVEIADLPPAFPRMAVDTRFYRLGL